MACADQRSSDKAKGGARNEKRQQGNFPPRSLGAHMSQTVLGKDLLLAEVACISGVAGVRRGRSQTRTRLFTPSPSPSDAYHAGYCRSDI